MNESRLGIGELAAATGCKVPTIRYYEAAGLLAAPGRSAGNQRRYRTADLARLRFIRRARDLGFSLDAVRELLALARDASQPCAEADRITLAHLAEVNRKIGELEQLRGELQGMLGACRHGSVAECEIIGALAAAGGERPAVAQSPSPSHKSLAPVTPTSP